MPVRALTLLLLILFVSMPLSARVNSSSLYLTGAAAAQKGDYKSAEKIFREVIKESPYFCLGHYGLGKVLLLTGSDMKESIQELQRACELDHSLAKAYFYLGLAYMMAGKRVYAIHAFDKAYKKDPAFIEALYNIGALYDEIGAAAKARLSFARYLSEKSRGEGEIF